MHVYIYLINIYTCVFNYTSVDYTGNKHEVYEFGCPKTLFFSSSLIVQFEGGNKYIFKHSFCKALWKVMNIDRKI